MRIDFNHAAIIWYKLDMTKKIQKSDQEWEKELNPELYKIARNKGTEAPYTGKYYESEEEGIYNCSACGNPLFKSETKFHSGSGWPSFYEALEGGVEYHDDSTHGMSRTEVTCAKCDAHLGHVFPDGPSDKTGKRYCINSISLDLKKDN